ncbi:hypothetical protein H0H92_007036 [Tricholoma furcatifolium]|nr:hypothetical protein H0H92_007036 [Tricholoma furcatifolium]
MAAAVAIAAPNDQQSTQQPTNPNKRYRPAPAKTFQCRGYGDCRMVFSRSEHLARHIRKHTGERPFTCHCSKQFSRLDNLRQHAQTVHADKQEMNERMMRDLTSLHASMAAANRIGNSRNARRAVSSSSAPPPPPPPQADSPSTEDQSATGDHTTIVKQEHISYDAPPDDVYQSWGDAPKYFESFPSRPSTSERLPPLSSIVSASINPQQQSQSQQAYFPAHLRPRPGTAGRPSSSSNSATSFYPNPPTNPLSTTAPKSFYSPPSLHYPRTYGSFDSDSSSNAQSESSPFYFAPPENPASNGRSASSNSPPANHPSAGNPRKRAFGGPDGPMHPYDEYNSHHPPHHPSHPDYEYGSESRPQSRRLSVMELCNDGAESFVNGFLNGERPTTAGASALGLVGSTTLGIVAEHPATTAAVAAAQHQQDRRPSPTGSLASAGGASEGRQGRVTPPSRRVTPHINGGPPVNGGANGPNGYAPPPRPHSTFSVASTTSSATNPNSPSIGGYPSPQTPHFAYPQHLANHQQHSQHSGYGQIGLVSAMSSLHASHNPHHHSHSHPHQQHLGAAPSPIPMSAASYYTHSPAPRSASLSVAGTFSPRSPGMGGHLAQQQAQAFQALQQGYGGGYGGGIGGGAGMGGGYDYANGYSA